MEVLDPRPALAPAISLVCAALVFLTGRHRVWRVLWSLSAAVVKLLVVASMLPGVMRGTVYVSGTLAFPPGLGFGFRVDGMGMFFGLVSSTLWVLTTVYALGYMKGGASLVRFFGFLALCVSTTVAIAFAENLLTLFVFYELLTVCTWPLVVHTQTPQARRAGHLYLAYLLAGGGLVLVGCVMVYDAAGTLTLSRTGLLHPETGGTVLAAIFVTLVLGFGVKTAILPVHAWLPAAMVAPTPVSALLHAVAVVKVGAFGLLRVIYNVFGVELLRELGYATALAWLAAFTILTGSVMALRQDNLKRRLAWSTISQVAYIALAAALLNAVAAVAAIAHLANQAFAKITMFFVAGAVERTTGRRRVRELAGIGYRMPVTMGMFTIAAFSFMGMPLTAGFVTKWYLSLGAIETGAWGFAIVMGVSALLNAACWLPIVYLAWFRTPRRLRPARAEAPWSLLLPTVICAAYVLLLGTTFRVPGAPLSLAREAVRAVFGP